MIAFISEYPQLRINQKRKFYNWLNKIINANGYKSKSITFLFTTDSNIQKVNKEFLNHDYPTDIITFPGANNNKLIEADIFISLDTVKTNASTYNSKIKDEFLRVLAHGVLHLTGYNDTNDKEKAEMRQAEENAINLFYSLYPETNFQLKF